MSMLPSRSTRRRRCARFCVECMLGLGLLPHAPRYQPDRCIRPKR